MTASADPHKHLIWGMILGIALQPLALFTGGYVWLILFADRRMLEGFQSAVAVFLFFGVVQAIVILPASGIFLLARKEGIVRGLLWSGIFLAVCNVLLGLFVFPYQ